jgi:hypothetical protein
MLGDLAPETFRIFDAAFPFVVILFKGLDLVRV